MRRSRAMAACLTCTMLISVSSIVSASEWDDGYWFLDFKDRQQAVRLDGGDDLWDLTGTDSVGDAVPAATGDYGIMLEVRPVVKDGKSETELLILVRPDLILVEVPTERGASWVPISRQEFDDLMADVDPDEIVVFVLMF